MSIITSRRSFLAGAATAAALPLSPLLADPAPAPSDTPLKALAARSGRKFGSAIYGRFQGGPPGPFDDPRCRDLLVRECDVVVPGNELKWIRLQRQPGAPQFGPADQIVAFAEANHLDVRGHCLVWQNVKRTPPWLLNYDFGGQPAATATKLIEDHIDGICRRYGSRIQSYDVVNEAIDPATGDYRVTPLSTALGGTEALLDLAYHATRAAAPGAELVYNDYMSWQSDSATHRAGVLKLLEGFRKRGTPVDALGVQSHLFGGGKGLAQGPRVADPAAWRAFMNDVVGMGYRVLVTELDVNDLWLPGDIAQRDALSAQLVGAYLDLMLSYRQVHSVIAWDLVDRYSFLQTDAKRRDGAPRRPCLFDDDYQPKPLRAAIAKSLAAATPV